MHSLFEKPPQPRGCWAAGEQEQRDHAPSWLYDERRHLWWCTRCEPPRGACPHCHGAAPGCWRERPAQTSIGWDGTVRSSPQGYVCRWCHPAWDDVEAQARKRIGLEGDVG
jgi:hypothetical protein